MRRLELVLGPALAVVAACVRAPLPPPSPSPSPSPLACEDHAFRQMDFWLGDWDLVIRARSAPDSDTWAEARGTNQVTATLGRCVVQESFRGDGPGHAWAGMSVSTYVPQVGGWRQTWVDDSGGYIALHGGPEGATFALYGEPREPPDHAGAKTQMRMVFKDITRDAFVWSWERGIVGGAAWTPMMEIRYTRRR